ncbi:MAG: shikimate dehydrogenase [Coriobacteriia bacterium]|nr:shikimate dehydrogenase [Coriobacteriia bacterium]
MNKQEERECFAVIGTPVEHSLSAMLHTAVFKKLGMPWRTVLVDPGNSENFISLIEEMREGSAECRGANITIPYKETVLPLCDELLPSAACCGAVNTLWRSDTGHKLIGANTDVGGFIEAVEAQLGIDTAHLRSVVLCGTGGAARAIASGLIRAGIGELTVLSRTDHRAASFVESLRCEEGQTTWRGVSYADISQVIDPSERFDLGINATPLGMLGDATQEMPREWLGLVERQVRKLFDVVYRRSGPTTLVQWAREHHIPASDGLIMLVEQAVLSLRLWGVTAEPDELRAIMREALVDEGILQ